MQRVAGMLSEFYSKTTTVLGLPDIMFSKVDVVEIIIISFLFYHMLMWIKSTRAWDLFKGILAILVFVLIAAIFQMNTILWIAQNMLSVGLVALVIIFQPELRKALENLGGRNLFGRIFSLNNTEKNKFSDKTVDELIKASFAMGRVKTGALIVIENNNNLNEFIKTGIDVDAILTSQLLINIFEKNTPLHDGAVIVRGDRVVSATCYLPLSDSTSLSKEFGMRHRAALGVSEASDSLTIVVSEQTGKISFTMKGKIYHDIDQDTLRGKLVELQTNNREEGGLKHWKRRLKNGKKDL